MNPKAILAVTQLIPLLIPIAAAIATEGTVEQRRDAVLAAIKPQLRAVLAGVEGVAGQDWYDEEMLAQAISMGIDAALMFMRAIKAQPAQA